MPANKIKIFVLVCILSVPCLADDNLSSYVPNLAQGAKTYQVYCSSCHGTRGMADTATSQAMKTKPAVLGDPLTLNRLSPHKVYSTVTEGIYKSGMPSFRHISDQERWNVAAFVFTLNCNFQQPTADFRSSLNWLQTRVQTDLELTGLFKKRGVPEKYLQRELSAARFVTE